MQIEIKHIIPSPLSDLNHNDSDIWGRDFSFQSGETYQVTAASGTGKTSLLNILYGLRKDYQGNIVIDKHNITNLTSKNWQNFRKYQLAYCPQGLWLFDELTALENIVLKNQLTQYKKESEIQEMLKIAGMYEHQNKTAGILSYGQKQRIAIIRALCQPFQFIFLDEAFSHLDKENTATMWELILDEAKSQSAGIILTSLGNEEFHCNKSLKL